MQLVTFLSIFNTSLMHSKIQYNGMERKFLELNKTWLDNDGYYSYA